MDEKLKELEDKVVVQDQLFKCLLELLISKKEVFTQAELQEVCARHSNALKGMGEAEELQRKLNDIKQRFENE